MNTELDVPQAIRDRLQYSQDRLGLLRNAIRIELERDTQLASAVPDVAVYATGSLGRSELGPTSDLDLFLVDVANREQALGNLDRIRLQALLIQVNDDLKFPRFDGDGSFIQVHRIDDLRLRLGTPEDDTLNVFTARMLLLLESTYLHGETAYGHLVDFVIDTYFRDEAGRAEEFVPMFLLNDFVRYWKTLCLAYEASRICEPPPAPQPDKGKVRHGLMKLRFSRAWMCFNGVAYILAGLGRDIPSNRAREMVRLAPVERMKRIAVDHKDQQERIQSLLNQYAWFLVESGISKHDLRKKLEDDGFYADVRDRGQAFCDELGHLVTDLARGAGLERQLVI